MKAIPRWLLTALALTMLLFLGGGVWFYRVQENLALRQIEKDLLAIADLKTQQIANWRAERLGDAGVIMRSPFFTRGVVRWLVNHNSADAEQILTRFRSLRDNYHYRNVLLVNAAGKICLSLVEYPANLHEQADRALAAAFREQRPVFTLLHTVPEGQAPHIGVIAPLFVDKEKEKVPAGAVILQSDTRQFLYPMIQSWPTPSESAETLIVRREGNLVLFLNELRHQKGTAIKWLAPLSQKDLPAAMAIQGKEGFVRGKDYRGEKVLAALKKIPDSPWFMVAKVDESEALAGWRFRAILIIALVLGLFLTTAALMVVIWQRNAKAHYRALYQAEAAQRQAEQRRRESEAQLELAIKASNFGLWDWDLKTNKVYYSPEWKRQIGYEDDEISDDIKEWQGRVHPDDLEGALQTVRSYIEKPWPDYELEFRFRHKDGSYRWILSRASLLYDNKKNPIRMIGLHLDVTDRKKAEELLRKSEERYRGILDNMMEGFQILDKDWRYLYVNDTAAAHGRRTREQLLGQTIMEAYPGIEQTDMFVTLRRCMDERTPQRMTNKFVYPDGTKAWFELSVQPLSEGISILSLDISGRRQAEETLETNLARQKVAMDLARLVQWEYDVKKDQFIFDDQFYALYGTTADQQGGTRMSAKEYARRFLPPEETPIVEESIAEALAATNPDYYYQIEHRIIRADGQERIIIVRFAIVKDENGHTVKIYGANQDITDLKRVEKALRESEERYRLTFDQAPVGVAHVGLDGRYLLVNQRLCEILGYSNEELLNMTAYEVTCPDEIETARTLHEKMISKKSPGYSREKRYTCKDGSVVWAHVTVSSVWDPNGQLKHMIIAVQDISERKEAEAALHQQEILLNEVGAIAKIGGWEMDLVTRKAKWTKATYDIVEIEPGQPIPGPDEHLGYYLPEYRPMIKEAMRALEEDDRPLEFEAQLKTAKGNILWLRALGRAKRKDGKCVRLYGTVQNVTERRRIEEEKAKLENQLLRAQKLEAIGTLAGGIAHDFNNILSAQLGYTELALEDARGNPRMEKSLQKAIQASLRATSLVKQILSFSRQTEHELRPMRIGPVAEEALELLRASIPTSIEIIKDLQDSQTVLADATQIHQIIMNLCSNAAHAMREKGGVLEVKLDSVRLDQDNLVGLEDIKPGNYQRLTVRDSGHGMGKKIIERIFDPFFTTKGEGEGTGLGLSVIYGIVKDHGGSIKVYSEVGKGTVFHVYFPLIEDEGEEVESLYRKGPLPTGTERVLLVDDEEMLVDVIGQTLELLGYKITGCTSSREALDLFKAAPDDYDILVTDFTMPNMTGDVLAKEALAIKPSLPVVLCTGYSEKIDKQKAKQMGIGRFLMKPVEEHELAEVLRTLLNEANHKAGSDEGNEFDPSWGEKTLLLVDDEVAIFDSLKRTLKPRNINVIYAETGEKAIEIYQNNENGIDVILMDLGMPGMGGAKTADQLLEMDPQAKIIMMSGYGKWDSTVGSLDKRIAGFLDKPFSSKEILRLIGKLTAQKVN